MYRTQGARHVAGQAPTRRPGSGDGPDQDTSAESTTTWTVAWSVGLVQRGLLWTTAVMVGLDLLASAGAAEGAPYVITRFFDGDDKINFPTGFKTTLLLAATLLFAVHAALARWDGDRFRPGWRLLVAVSAFAFVDETTYLHQSLSELLHQHLHTQGALRYAWVVVYIPAAFALGVIVLRHARYLAPAVRWPLLFGGALYALGALAFEPIKAQAAEADSDSSLLFKLVAAASDSLEMIGLAVLVAVLVAMLARRVTVIELVSADPPAADRGTVRLPTE